MYGAEPDENSNKRKNEILPDDENSAVIKMSNENGGFVMTAYQVFPGIRLIYSEAHIQSIEFEERKTLSDDLFEITHCREGRLEYNVNGEFCYLSRGDLAIARTNNVSSSSYFPLRHYHGITIRIDIKNAPKCLSCFLRDVTGSLS